jgi:glycosyltransferase involved in cell wall biosynthesis
MKTEPYLHPFPVSTTPLTLQVSVVIPVYNEVESVPHLLEAIAQVLRTEGLAYEIIAVDDGSKDGTTALLKQLAQARSDLRAVLLRRNYGQTAAMAAGFHHAKAPHHCDPRW